MHPAPVPVVSVRREGRVQPYATDPLRPAKLPPQHKRPRIADAAYALHGLVQVRVVGKWHEGIIAEVVEPMTHNTVGHPMTLLRVRSYMVRTVHAIYRPAARDLRKRR